MPCKELMPGVRLISWGGDMEKVLAAKTKPNESRDDALWRILWATFGTEGGAR